MNYKSITFVLWLFLVLGLMAAGSLLALAFSWPVALLLLIALWSFCRWYYFMFYVIEDGPTLPV